MDYLHIFVVLNVRDLCVLNIFIVLKLKVDSTNDQIMPILIDSYGTFLFGKHFSEHSGSLE